MFTGIVEETGRVLRRTGARLVVSAGATLDATQVGSSLAVNGVCLTAVELGADSVGFDVGPETLARSALGDLSPGDEVNLERPMRLDGFVGTWSLDTWTASGSSRRWRGRERRRGSE
ncbi:MAG: riboflavin synthase, alpha subunit [Candidatus Rokubacteria bacterium]|nr:riboflavin synthase, alpha subunit [Candidatus Rokubacteria bacterium]